MRFLKYLVALAAGSAAFVVLLSSLSWAWLEGSSRFLYTTTEFPSGPDARRFLVAVVDWEGSGPKGHQYSAVPWGSLAKVSRTGPRSPFLLPEQKASIPSAGDIYAFKVLEESAGMQLIEVYFGNTYSSWSRYRAFPDRIEPVSYRHDGGPMAMLVILFLMVPVFYFSRWLFRKVRAGLAGRENA